MEYLIHYVKFKLWPALFYVNSLFSQIWCTLFTPICTEIDNWDFGNAALGWKFQFLPYERDQKLEFSRLGPALPTLSCGCLQITLEN